MLALIALGYSLICVLLLNAGWGRRLQNPWWWVCVVGAWLLSGFGFVSHDVIISRGYLLLASIAFFVLIIVGSVFKTNSLWMKTCSWGIFFGLWICTAGQLVCLNPKYMQWKQETPFESMELRVPEQKPDYAEWSKENAEYWKNSHPTTEQHFFRNEWTGRHSRSESIQALHASTLTDFNNAAGFGSVRMGVIHPLAEHFLPDAVKPIRQKLDYVAELVSTGQNSSDIMLTDVADMNARSTADFSNPTGFGYVKSRSEVAGFQPHRFSKYPDAPKTWDVKRIDLVSLLLHEEPVVYLSNDLPRMADVGKLSTRDRDTFEKDGLAAIRKGNELYVRGDQDKVRVIGAMRNFDQCIKCHGGNPGDLLGAFS